MKSDKTNEELLNSEHGKMFLERMNEYKGGDIFSLLTSMDDVFVFVAYAEENYPADLVEVLKVVLGLGEPYGIMVDVEGIGPIDTSIADLIKNLNKEGYITLASCSGLFKDHPTLDNKDVLGYISFEFDEDRSKLVKDVCEKIGLEFSVTQTFFKPSYIVRLKAPNDIEAEQKWQKFEELMLNNG